MDVDSNTPPPQSYTILRIKRKRNEEPLDALVVESRVKRKKSRGGIDVFQYAQTVEDDVWNDKKSQKDMQEQITKIARESPLKTEIKTAVPPAPADVPSIVPRQKEEVSRRYTVIEHEDAETLARRFPKMPPKVVSAKELLQQQQLQKGPEIKMYDAIPHESISSRTNAKPSAGPESLSEVDKFLPMLQDYLKIHDMAPNTPLEKAMSGAGTEGDSSDGDYVWDVFYHRPVTLSEWNEVANVATLTGLPPSFGDFYDSASDSEPEDEADEDSNAEEYYKNDYPDEDGSSDEFHEESDYDDMMHYRDDNEDSW